jgi:hypothetical protein
MTDSVCVGCLVLAYRLEDFFSAPEFTCAVRAFVDEHDSVFVVWVQFSLKLLVYRKFVSNLWKGTYVRREESLNIVRLAQCVDEGEEQPLGNYDIYLRYTKLIEDLLESFLSSHGIDQQVFSIHFKI